MTRLDDHAFSTGFSLAFGRIEFDAANDTPSGGGNGGNQAGVAPVASFNYVHRLSDRFRFGFTFFSLSGSLLDPSNDWAGRFEVVELSLLTISASPTLAFRVTDWLSVGGGPLFSYGVLNWDLRAEVPFVGEQTIRLDDLDDFQPAGRVGLLFHPNDDFGLSVHYNSKTKFDLSGDIDVPIGLTADFDLELPLAQFVEVSAFWNVTDRLTLLALFNWEDWSVLDNLTVGLGSRSIAATTGFKDTYKGALGANYRLRESWLLQTGVSYDTSALRNRNRTTALPVDEQIRVAIGLQHDLREDLKLGFTFHYVNLGQSNVRTANVRGDYDNNELFVFGVALNWKKLPWSGRATL
jgi:long-chain fatty acid transport protein